MDAVKHIGITFFRLFNVGMNLRLGLVLGRQPLKDPCIKGVWAVSRGFQDQNPVVRVPMSRNRHERHRPSLDSTA